MRFPAALAMAALYGCAAGGPDPRHDAAEFLKMYNEIDQRLLTALEQADWRASTDVNDQHTGERIGAESALAAFRGSRYVIESARKHLALRQSLSDLEFRQLDKILLNAAESPGTIPDVVQKKIEAEARLIARQDSFTFCLDRPAPPCRSVTPNEIDDVLVKSVNLAERRKIWEASKQSGVALKSGLATVRDLRNRAAKELGYTSFFHLQVADYGMTVAEMMQLMDRTLADMQPLYDQLHLYARRRLARRYKQTVPPKTLPAHWLPNRWGQQWEGLVETADLDPLFKDKSAEWIVQQSERFYTSLGMPPLPKSFWEKSDLYQLPPGAKRKKNTHASAWHIDRASDVRSLMSVIPNHRWFETSHHELGHIYYYMAYSNPKVPHVLREGMNRAFHEAVGDLIAIAARQEPYLRQIGVMPESMVMDPIQYLLSQALETVVFLPWSAGTMTHFEHDLYEKNLPEDQFNKTWWEYVEKYQGVVPPAPRGEQFCDACTKTHVIDDPAQYYDYALAFLIKYQLHSYIARNILKQDPHNCNYYGNKQVGEWLMGLLSAGATQDWRQMIKEKTGEEISSRPLLDYFQPLVEYLKTENAR